MKTYLSLGIGDLFFLDSILTKEEKESISEIYWACRFGKVVAPLMENNPSYPNLIFQHTIDDEIGKQAMSTIAPVAVPFWHFRPDYPKNLEIGLKLFGIEDEWDNGNLQTVDAAGMFFDGERSFTESSFIKHANHIDEDYIVFHYPTSTRPRTDICSITTEDWQFLESLSKEQDMPVVVIADAEIDVPLTNYRLLLNPDIKYMVDVIANCNFCAGCDSFGTILASKFLPKENIFIKLSPNFTGWNNWLYRAFMPHSPEDVREIYKSYIGRP